MPRADRDRDPPDSPSELKARALRLLARREHTRAELARKLAPHAQSLEAIAQLLDALAARKHLSDERYAEARAHRLSRKYGAARIVHDLRAKGVSEEAAQQAAAAGAAGDLERARAIVARKYRGPATDARERAKRARFLLGRGFSGEVVRAALGAPPDADDPD